jgi:hypothetical protein
MKFIFFCTLTVLAIFACESPKTAPKQYLECYVRHDAATGNTKAEVVLKEGEPVANPIEIQQGIQYQRANMKLLPIQGLSYRYEYAADFVPDLDFDWKSWEGKPLNFKMKMNEMRDFGFGGPTLKRNEIATLQWKGQALTRGEVLVLMWEELKTGKTVPMELYTTGDETELEFPAAKMKELSPGQWSLYLVRRTLTKTQVANVEATGVAEYYSKVDTIEVRER